MSSAAISWPVTLFTRLSPTGSIERGAQGRAPRWPQGWVALVACGFAQALCFVKVEGGGLLPVVHGGCLLRRLMGQMLQGKVFALRLMQDENH